MFTWVEDIRGLSRLNKARRDVWDETLPLDQQSSACAECHRDLETTLSQMHACCASHLQEPDLHPATTKVLSSLHNHWEGLTVFSMAA